MARRMARVPEDIKAFLAEYRALCKRHKKVIGLSMYERLIVDDWVSGWLAHLNEEVAEKYAPPPRRPRVVYIEPQLPPDPYTPDLQNAHMSAENV